MELTASQPALAPSRRSASLLHAQLNRLNGRRLAPRTPEEPQSCPTFLVEREVSWLEQERAAVTKRAVTAPFEARAFERWFTELRQNGPGQHHPLFDWLAYRADHRSFRWFMKQELAAESAFDDLVALTQVGFPKRPKLELAHNYWDEMGSGNPKGMHGPMLQRLAEQLDIESLEVEIAWEALAVSNLMMGLAAHRRYAYHSVGCLGAVELTAPDRCEKVARGLERIGVGGSARAYYALHATMDIRHSRDWNAEVIAPLVQRDPRVARYIAEGALMRLEAGRRTFDRYAQHLLPPISPS